MPRDLDDDAPHRMEAADRALAEQDAAEPSPEQEAEAESPDLTFEAWAADSQLNLWLESRNLRRQVLKLERELTQRRIRRRARVAFFALSLGCVLAGTAWTAARWGSIGRAARGGAVCCAIALVLAAAAEAVSRSPRGSTSRTMAQLEDDLERARDDQQILGAFKFLQLRGRRHLYRENTTDLIEQYRSESRRYRRVHNGLQILVMTGSAGSTTVAALDWGQQPTWQGITLTCISFAITLASAFTGYYKYRERSYFLQQTADSIEEELNALTLGVGDYAQFEGNEAGALALFTKKVEELRNEQRRRQQQLDQPSEQATEGGPPPK